MSKELELEGKFKTADELGLTEQQYCGLVQTLAWLEAGKLDHENEKTRGFDMNSWGGIQYMNERGQCGTACCIGGTAEVLGNTFMGPQHRAANGNASAGELDKLFYPGGGLTYDLSVIDYRQSHPGWKASTAQAAVALRGYLETGRTDWDAAMKTPKTRRK